MKILLIDDDDALTTIFTGALTKEGFQAVIANTGQEGIDKAKVEAPDLILLDQVLPDLSGNDILKKLKLDEKTKNIPVIILSNFSQEELVKEAINEGAVDYIFKYQAEPKDVIEKIKNTLKQN
jgi:DNA-binding response OmpR family regulator